MTQAKNGDTVRVHYIGRLDDGSIFDASEEVKEQCGDGGDACNDSGCGCGCSGHGASNPMEFVIGEGNLIPKFEEAVIGLEPGQSIKVKIAADEAYGPRIEEMVAVIDRSEIPADIEPNIGDHLEVILEDGTPMPVMVIDVTEAAITLDANHPLAGMDLNFEIRLVDIV